MKNITTAIITATVTSLATATALALIRKRNETNGINSMIEIIEFNFAETAEILNRLGISIEEDYHYNELRNLYEAHLEIKDKGIKYSELKKLNERVLEYSHIRFTQG